MRDVVLELAREIEATSGFVIPPRGLEPLAALARERAMALGVAGIDGYLARLRAQPESHEWRSLLGRITVKESRLFRGRPRIEALAQRIVPEIVAGRAAGRLRIWSAGCARGEEAATLALVLADHPLLAGWQWSILATDVDDAALADAEQGLYGVRAMGGVPAEVVERHFERRGELYEMRPRIRSHIHYRHQNLAAPQLDLPEAPFDVIFLRNVLIYFSAEVQRRVVASVERVLAPRGWLFLGPSESLLPLEVALRPRDLGTCFCYGWPSPPACPSAGPGAPSVLPAAEPSVAGEGSDRPTLPLPPAPARLPFEEQAAAMLALLDAAEPETGRRAASQLRLDYPESPAAHLLEGLGWLRSGLPEQALLAFRAARYLAPELAEIRFLLGRTLAELGRRDQARREFRAALAASERPAGAIWAELPRLGVPDLETIRVRCRELVGGETNISD